MIPPFRQTMETAGGRSAPEGAEPPIAWLPPGYPMQRLMAPAVAQVPAAVIPQCFRPAGQPLKSRHSNYR